MCIESLNCALLITYWWRSFVSFQSPVYSAERLSFDLDLQPCDTRALLDNESEPVKMVLEGVDIQRGYGMVRADDGRQAQLTTVSVEAWHIKEHCEEELPKESVGQLHEGDAYIIRWTYSITTLGEPCSFEEKTKVCSAAALLTQCSGGGFCQWEGGRNPASWAAALQEERGQRVFSGKVVTPASARKEPRPWWQWSWAATEGHRWVSDPFTGHWSFHLAQTRSLSSPLFTFLPLSGSASGWNVINVYLIGCSGVGEWGERASMLPSALPGWTHRSQRQPRRWCKPNGWKYNKSVLHWFRSEVYYQCF